MYERLRRGKVGSNWALGRCLSELSWIEMRGTGGTALPKWDSLRERGITESGRAWAFIEASVGVAGNVGGSGVESVTTSLMSRAIHSSSSMMLSSSTIDENELLRTGSDRSGMDFMKRMDARCDLKVGARARLDLQGDSSSEVGGVVQGVLGLEYELEDSLLALEGVGDCSRLLENERAEERIEAEGGEGKSKEIPRPENRRLMSSRGESDPGEDAAEREGGEGERVIGGGEGVRTRGALEGGKKSSKDKPSAPVKTTLRESRFMWMTWSADGRPPTVAHPEANRLGCDADGTDDVEEHE